MDLEPTATQALETPVGSRFAPTPYNPRKPWTPGQARDFKRSLFEFGDLSGIIHNRRTGHLVGGNKRTLAFEECREQAITITENRADNQGSVAHGFVMVNGTRFSYREVDWDEAKEKLANIAANKWGAEWEWEHLSDLVKEINTLGLDTILTGFDQAHLDTLLAGTWNPPRGISKDTGASDQVVQHQRTFALQPQEWEDFLHAKDLINRQSDQGDVSEGRAVQLLALSYIENQPDKQDKDA